MDKVSYTMFRQIMSALNHMPQINKESEQEILDEIARIKEGRTPGQLIKAGKKKDVEDVDKKIENS